MKNIHLILCALLCTFHLSHGMIAKALLGGCSFNKIELLISQDYDINEHYPKKQWESRLYGGYTPLHIACLQQNVTGVKFFLNQPTININAIGRNEETPLHLVIKKRDKESHTIAQLLIADPRININQCTTKGETNLHFTCHYHNPEIARMLLEHQNINIYIRNNANQTAIQRACKDGPFTIMTMLLEHDPRLLHERDEYGRDLLQLAIYHRHKKISEQLIQRSDINISATDNSDNTALHWACLYDYKIVVNFMLNEYKKKRLSHLINAQNSSGNTPLHLCLTNRRQWISRTLQCIPLTVCNEIITQLLDAGANPILVDNEGNTPWAYYGFASGFLNQENVNRMITSMDENENTQLHLYITSVDPSEDLLKTLVAQPNLPVLKKNKSGETAIDIAYKRYYLAATQSQMLSLINKREMILHTLLRCICVPISCASFCKILEGLLPEIQQIIMHYYYILNIDTIIARGFTNNDYYQKSIEEKNEIRQGLIAKPQAPHLLWSYRPQ